MGDWFDDYTDYSAWGSDSDFGGYDAGYGFGDTSWMDSYLSPSAYTGTSDILSSVGMYSPGSMADPFSTFNAGQMADPTSVNTGGFLGNLGNSIGDWFGGGGGGASNSLIGGLLGAAGPLAGLIGTLASGGQGPSSMPQIPTNAKAQLNAGANVLAPYAQGNTALQQQQSSLLNAIASGQGLAQPYAQAIEKAFEPQLGSLYEQAVNAGRARGFYDAPATSPPGGAVLGPGLSNLQGQIAGAKIAQMNALPGLFQQPINTQAMAGGQWANSMLGAAGQQIGQQTNVPIGPQVGQGIAGVLGGAAAGYNATQQANQQQQFQNSLLQALKYPGYGA